MRAIFIACLLTFAANAVRADVIVMRNGDRISGEILAMAEGRLVVRTAHAGEITLEWNAIESLESDRPLAVMLQGESAPVLRRMNAAMDPASVAYINPQPHESGTGTTYTGRIALSANYASGNAPSRRLYGDGELTARAAAAYRSQLSGKAEHRADPGSEANSAARERQP